MKKNKPTLLFVSSSTEIYGGEINLIQLLKSINKKKYNILCLYNRISKLESYIIGHNVYLLPQDFYEYNISNIIEIILIILRLLFIIIKFKVKLIYINVPKEFKYIRIISKVFKIPTILHIHAEESDESLRWIKANQATRIIFPSKYTMNITISHSEWIDKRKCSYVHNAVDFNSFYPQKKTSSIIEPSLKLKYPTLSIVGQLNCNKGQHIFIEMANKLKTENIQLNYIIVGDVKKINLKYKIKLLKMVNNYQLNKDIIFAGFRKEIPEILSLSDLLIVASLRETFGRVIIEAMACGTPVVASSVGGINEIFEDGKGGLFFKPNSVDDLVKKVRIFIDNPNWWKKQKRVAVETCKKKYCQKKHTNKIESYIDNLIKVGRKVRSSI